MNTKAQSCTCLCLHQWCHFSFSLLILLSNSLPLTLASVGTAARYSTPYIPTACYGSDTTEFPENGLFAAAGEGVWNNGAACGRQYLVSCISAPAPSSCISGAGTIQVKIIDRAASAVSHPSHGGATLVLSTAAFGLLVNPPTTSSINIEYRQV